MPENTKCLKNSDNHGQKYWDKWKWVWPPIPPLSMLDIWWIVIDPQSASTTAQQLTNIDKGGTGGMCLKIFVSSNFVHDCL